MHDKLNRKENTACEFKFYLHVLLYLFYVLFLMPDLFQE